MSKNSHLLKAIKLCANLIVAFDRYFRRPYRIEQAIPQKWLSGRYYLIREKLIDENYQLLREIKDPISLIVRPWDKKWRIVGFDIKENNRNFRNRLREKLKELGFQRLQRSIWISPLAVKPFILNFAKASNKGETVFLFEGQIKGQNPQQLVKNLWPLESWMKKANKLIAQIEHQSPIREETKTLFWQLLADHPLIPLDLLPQSWPLKKLISVLSQRL